MITCQPFAFGLDCRSSPGNAIVITFMRANILSLSSIVEPNCVRLRSEVDAGENNSVHTTVRTAHNIAALRVVRSPASMYSNPARLAKSRPLQAARSWVHNVSSRPVLREIYTSRGFSCQRVSAVRMREGRMARSWLAGQDMGTGVLHNDTL